MLNIDGKSFNLGFALGLTEEEFRGHYAPIFKNKHTLDKAWAIVRSNKNGGTDQQIEEPSKPEPRRNSKKGRDEGVHSESESDQPDLH